MQVEEPHEELDPERFTPEDFLFPSLCKQGLGLVCEYCAIMTGYSIRYPSMNCYLEHVCMKHQGYSVYAFPEDLVRAKIQIELDYRRKLRDQYKDNLKKAKGLVPRKSFVGSGSILYTKVADFKELPQEQKLKFGITDY